MKVSCNKEIFEKFTEASFHAVVFDNVNLLSEETAGVWKQKAVQDVEARGIKPELLTENSAIKQWRDAYYKFGLKPSKYRSSIEQLYKRALKGDYLQTRLPLVNLYCYISILNMTPMGGYDLSRVKDKIEIRYTAEAEDFQAIGERVSIKSPPGIVSYADASGIICWGWNHRDSLRTCLNEKTRTAIFFADSATGATYEMSETAIRNLSKTLLNSGCRLISEFVLDSKNPQAEFKDFSL
jgi:lysyl-tRNA synthetase class 2